MVTRVTLRDSCFPVWFMTCSKDFPISETVLAHKGKGKVNILLSYSSELLYPLET